MKGNFSEKRHFLAEGAFFKHFLFPLIVPLCLLLACQMPSGCASADIEEPVQPGKVDPQKVEFARIGLENFLNYYRGKNQFYGMSVAVIQGDQVVYRHDTGYTQNRKFHLGSITKIFTATSIMRLIEEGKIDLDAPLTDYMAELKIERAELGSRPVTIRHLLSHTSGLPDMRYSKSPLADSTEVPFKVPHQVVPAGIHYRYSNTGFMILGELVSRRAGMPYAEFIKQQIFDPLEMHDTQTQMLTGASGVLTTADDLAHFAIMYLNHGVYKGKRILDAKTIRMMVQQPLYYPPADFQEYCGLGWRTKRGPQGVATMFHIGGADGIAGWLQLFPRHGMAILYVGDPPTYSDDTMGMLVGIQAKLGYLATAFAGEENPLYFFKPTPPSEKQYEMYPGEYKEIETGKLVTVTNRGGTLYFQREGAYAYPLLVQTNHVFTGGWQALSHDFVHAPGTNELVGIAAYDGYFARVTETKVKAETASSK